MSPSMKNLRNLKLRFLWKMGILRNLLILLLFVFLTRFSPRHLHYPQFLSALYTFPYHSTDSTWFKFRPSWKKLLTSAYLHINIRFIARPSPRLFHFFSFKDRIPLRLRSHVLYNFCCRRCGASYVGETCRHLHTRVSEQHGDFSTNCQEMYNPFPLKHPFPSNRKRVIPFYWTISKFFLLDPSHIDSFVKAFSYIS